jgi:hypothetical protein
VSEKTDVAPLAAYREWLAGHQQEAADATPYDLFFAGWEAARASTERDAGRIVAVLVKRLGGYAVLTVSELTAVDGRHLTQKRDAYGGLAFKVEG